MATVVTALYDIGRGNLKGKWAHRPFSKYLEWFKNLLQLNVPLVVFTDSSLLWYIKEHRPENYQTKVVTRDFSELESYKLLDRIQDAIDKIRRENVKEKHLFECPEFITAKYQVIQYTKVDLLQEVSSENPFDTSHFFWLDAGTYQERSFFDPSVPWPDKYKLNVLEDKYILVNDNLDLTDKTPLENLREYVLSHKNCTRGYFQGGIPSAIAKVHKLFFNQVEELLRQDLTTNDQIILQILALKEPEVFFLWTQNEYRVKFPECDRMVPYELALGTPFKKQYAVNSNLKVLAVATRELPEKSFEKWEMTAKHFGYDYEILGRETKWEGFLTKTNLVADRLQTLDSKYCVIADCTDIFFCGSSDELVEKFETLNTDLLVGGETMMHCPGIKFDKEVVTKHLKKLGGGYSPFFPNAGFLMGKTEALRTLKEHHRKYKDDQTACYETIYLNEFPLKIDYASRVIGNVPNPQTKKFVHPGFELDKVRNRYRSVESGEYPVVFHFPGCYFSAMSQFYQSVKQEVEFSELKRRIKKSSVGAFFVFLILLVLVLLGLWFLK